MAGGEASHMKPRVIDGWPGGKHISVVISCTLGNASHRLLHDTVMSMLAVPQQFLALSARPIVTSVTKGTSSFDGIIWFQSCNNHLYGIILVAHVSICVFVACTHQSFIRKTRGITAIMTTLSKRDVTMIKPQNCMPMCSHDSTPFTTRIAACVCTLMSGNMTRKE